MQKLLKVLAALLAVAAIAIGVAVFVLARRGAEKLAAPARRRPPSPSPRTPSPSRAASTSCAPRPTAASATGAYERAHPEANTRDVALTGGFEFTMGPLGSFYSANLTPDPETGIGRRSDAELARAIATGVLPDGSLSIFMRYSASNLSAEDIGAVIAYLRSLPPVKNAVPAGEVTMLGKAMLGMVDIGPDTSPCPPTFRPPTRPTSRAAPTSSSTWCCAWRATRTSTWRRSSHRTEGAGSPPDPSPAPTATWSSRRRTSPPIPRRA